MIRSLELGELLVREERFGEQGSGGLLLDRSGGNESMMWTTRHALDDTESSTRQQRDQLMILQCDACDACQV